MANNNHRDVKYSRLENGQQPDAGNNSSGFGKSIKFVAILAVVIVLFTCTTWAFKKPESSKAQTGIHSFSYEDHLETEIIFSAQRQQEQLEENSTVSSQGNAAKDAKDKPQTDSVMAVKSQGSRVPQKQQPIKTLFTSLHSTFDGLKLGKNKQIPTLAFVQTSSDLKPLLERIGSTVSMIENDLKGNAEKVQAIYKKSPQHSKTLQDMLLYDIKMGRAKEDSSSVVALLWIKRAYQFIERFLRYVADGQQPVPAAQTAYDEMLSKYHSWFVRSAFKIAMNLLPSRTEFMEKMVEDKQDLKRPDYEAQVVSDMNHYLDGMLNIFNILEDFYKDHHLET
ncbi:uncharacterized protein [Asterias amurensis]|uniref:uncharacterized protein n=1 Tax=Asterias amurensis TaxID=7602 RepID=UPI003AB594D5